MAEIFDVSIDYLLGVSDSRTPDPARQKAVDALDASSEKLLQALKAIEDQDTFWKAYDLLNEKMKEFRNVSNLNTKDDAK